MFVLQVLCMIFIIFFFNVTNNNSSFHIDTSIGTAVQVLQPYPYLHTSVLSTNFLRRPGLPFLISYYEFFRGPYLFIFCHDVVLVSVVKLINLQCYTISLINKNHNE